MTSGRSLELYFVDGKPDGMLTAEVFNWTGHVLRIPRTRLADGLRRPQANQTGVYLLLGQDGDGPLAYIGEAEDMARRIGQHAREKDWWDVAVLVTTTGDGLHKAHVKYLESRLVAAAREAAAMRMENGNQPTGASLNEAAVANMESFLDTLYMVLPAIRVDLFQSGRRAALKDHGSTSLPTTKSVFHLLVPRHGVDAVGELADGELVVKAGSQVRSVWVGNPKHAANYRELHESLVEKGIIQKTDGTAVMTEDYAFSSPSAAAAVVSGRSSNGRTAWKLPDGRTYADWETEQIAKDTP
ncbi:GIY-YIG nuclease family protein [Nioella nitratireducens]|uniref:GIY-YIG nuclease family protein n=1 Tax=Nioella nitratireducens TaxID=1287720 RepID=UPI0008FD8B22|nr:GIY-YIG nuclease family protein [Nioella nitratireducens]